MNYRTSGVVAMACALAMGSVLSVGCSDDAAPGGTTNDGGTSGGPSDTGAGTSGNPSDSGTSGNPADGGQDSGKDAAVALCDPTIPAAAQEFTDTFTTATMPPTGTATGGTLESGEYLQVEKKNYEASGTGRKRKGVIRFDATAKTFSLAGSDEGVVGARGGTYVIAGNKLTLNFTCPTTASATFEFTYVAPRFDLYNYGSKSTDGFVKQ